MRRLASIAALVAIDVGGLASAVYLAAGLWQLSVDWRLGALFGAIGVYGLAVLAYYRRHILA